MKKKPKINKFNKMGYITEKAWEWITKGHKKHIRDEKNPNLDRKGGQG
jgi:hypothetical protein